MKKEIHYNIRTVVAASEEEAIKKIQEGKFCERHFLCDKVFTKEQLLNKLLLHGKKKQPINNSDKNPWSFVEQYYPNYHSSDEIFYSDSLAKIVHHEDLEKGSAALRVFREDCNSNMNSAEKLYNKVMVEIYEEAIKNFLNPQS